MVRCSIKEAASVFSSWILYHYWRLRHFKTLLKYLYLINYEHWLLHFLFWHNKFYMLYLSYLFSFIGIGYEKGYESTLSNISTTSETGGMDMSDFFTPFPYFCLSAFRKGDFSHICGWYVRIHMIRNEKWSLSFRYRSITDENICGWYCACFTLQGFRYHRYYASAWE